MHRIDTPNARPDTNGTGKAGYHLNNDLVGVDPTNLDPAALNAIQEEICSVIESQDIPLAKGTNNQLLTAIQRLIVDVAYPVHRTIEFAADVDPNDLWPWTEWERFAEGRTTVGVLDGDDDFGTVGQDGGEKTHQLVGEELPKFRVKLFAATSSTTTVTDGKKVSYYGGETTNNDYNYVMKDSDDEPTLGVSSEVGGDEAHNNLQPYVVSAKWVRTA